MKNVCSLGFLGLLVLAGAISIGFQRLRECSGRRVPPHWLTWLGVAGVLVWLIVLVLVSVSYAQRANVLRNIYWSSERGPVNLANFYSRQLMLAFGLVVLGCFLAALAAAVPWRIYPTGALGFLLPILTFSIVLAFLVTSIILHLQEEARMFEAAYFDFARQLGVEDRTLEDLKSHPHDFETPRFGLWAEAVVIHRGYSILFGGGQVGRIPCFVLIRETPTKTTASCRQLMPAMPDESRHRFERIRSKIKKADLWASEGTFFLAIPLISRCISAELLRDAMDVLVDLSPNGKAGVS
jgi:hypothetical protein